MDTQTRTDEKVDTAVEGLTIERDGNGLVWVVYPSGAPHLPLGYTVTQFGDRRYAQPTTDATWAKLRIKAPTMKPSEIDRWLTTQHMKANRKGETRHLVLA